MEFVQPEPPVYQSTDSAGSQESPSPFVIVDGQRLFIDAPYLLPTDLPAYQRLDVQHALMQAVLLRQCTSYLGQSTGKTLNERSRGD